jgi:hypothetical protein
MAQPLLTYACTTDPFPLQASPGEGAPAVAAVQMVATNQTGAPVTLGGMSIQLPVGPAADALTLDPTSIAVVPPAGWTQGPVQSPPGAVLYTFLPGPGAGTVPAGGSLVFMLDAIEVNQQAGTATVVVMEGSGGCDPPECPTAPVPITRFPAGWGNVEFSALTPNVSPGGSASVQWSGPAGATYTLQFYTPATGVVSVPAPGAPPLGSSGVYPGTAGPALALQQTTVFTLQVTYTAGQTPYSAQRQVTVVVVPPAPTITRFDGQLGGTPGSPALTLTWATQNADHCQLTGTSEQLDTQGTRTLPNPVDTGPILPAYTLTASGAPGLAAATAVFDTPPRITRFTGTPVVNGTGMQLQLSWDASLAESCTITGVPGVLQPSGTVTVTPTAQAPLLSEYALTATARGKSDTSTLSLQWGTQPVMQTLVPGYTALGIAASPDGRLLVAATPPSGGQEVVLLFSNTTLQPLTPTSVPVASGPGPIAIDPDGTRVFAASGTTLAAFDAQTFEPVPGSPVALPIPVGGIAVSAGGDRVFVCSASATVFVVNAQTLAVTGQFQLPEPATAAGATADGLRLVFAAQTAIYMVDAQTYAPSAPPIPLPPAMSNLFAVDSVAISPDSANAVIAGWQTTLSGQVPTMPVVDLRTQAVQLIPVSVPSGDWLGSTVLAGSPDGSRLYAAATQASFHVFGDSPPSIQTSVLLRTVVSGGIGG